MSEFTRHEMAQAAAFFDKNGFAVFPALFEADQMKALAAASKKIVEAFDPREHRSIFSTGDRDRGRDRYFMESAEAVHCFLEEGAVDSDGDLNRPKQQAINKIGHALHDHVPEFGEFARRYEISQILNGLGYQQPELWQTMYIFKQPGIGGEVRWHQDASYLASEPARVIGMWLAIEDATLDNGCLWVQPGGHRSPLREIYEVAPGESTGKLQTLDYTPWPEETAAQAVEVSRGSLVIFSDHMPHYSSENTSKRSRQAFTMHFMDGRSTWSSKNWLQRKHLPAFVL